MKDGGSQRKEDQSRSKTDQSGSKTDQSGSKADQKRIKSRSKETVPGGKQFGEKKAAWKQKSIVERGANRKDG